MDKEQFTIASHVEVALLEEALLLANLARDEASKENSSCKKADALEKIDSFISETYDRLVTIDHIVY